MEDTVISHNTEGKSFAVVKKCFVFRLSIFLRSFSAIFDWLFSLTSSKFKVEQGVLSEETLICHKFIFMFK